MRNVFYHGLRAAGVVNTGAEPTHPEGQKDIARKSVKSRPYCDKSRSERKSAEFVLLGCARLMTRRRPPQNAISSSQARTMDRFLVKTEPSKMEHKKQPRRAVLRDDDDDDAANTPISNDEFMCQFTAYLARQSGLVKLSDDGNKITYGKPSGDDVYISSGDAFVKVEDSTPGSAAPPEGKRRRLEPVHEKTLPNPFDDFSLPDDVLASIPLP